MGGGNVREEFREGVVVLSRREGGTRAPLIIERDTATWDIFETWMRDGSVSRLNGPALIRRDPFGKVLSAEWYINGKQVLRPEPGSDWAKKCERSKWAQPKRWRLWREGRDCGRLKFEFKQGRVLLKRQEGGAHSPQIIERDTATGDIIEIWMMGDRLGRATGPALIRRDARGTVLSADWYIYGKQVRPPEPGSDWAKRCELSKWAKPKRWQLWRENRDCGHLKYES
jgi:hypothetical protein